MPEPAARRRALRAAGALLLGAASPRARGLAGGAEVHPGSASADARTDAHSEPIDTLLVAELASGQITLFDAGRSSPIGGFAARPGLLDSMAFGADARHAYLASQDGWVGRYDLWHGTLVNEAQLGLQAQAQALALSADARWLLVALRQPQALVLVDAALRPVKSWPAASRDGRRRSAVAGLQSARVRSSFVVSFTDLAEIWEIAYDPKAEDFYDGLVHDFRMGEGLPTRAFLNPRRSPLPEPLRELRVDPEGIHALGLSGEGEALAAHALNLDVRRRVARVPVPGHPDWPAAVPMVWQGRPVWLLPDRAQARVSVIDRDRWTLLHALALPGRCRHLRLNAPRQELWLACAPEDGGADRMLVVDAHSLHPLAQWEQSGAAHSPIEFSLDGRRAYLGASAPTPALWALDCASRAPLARHVLQALPYIVHLGQWLAR